jgi:hypothetical protein
MCIECALEKEYEEGSIMRIYPIFGMTGYETFEEYSRAIDKGLLKPQHIFSCKDGKWVKE